MHSIDFVWYIRRFCTICTHSHAFVSLFKKRCSLRRTRTFFSIFNFVTLAGTGAQVSRKVALERRSDAHHYCILAQFPSIAVVVPRREHNFHIMYLAICLGACLSHSPSCLEFPSFYFIILILRPHPSEVFPEKDAGCVCVRPHPFQIFLKRVWCWVSFLRFHNLVFEAASFSGFSSKGCGPRMIMYRDR